MSHLEGSADASIVMQQPLDPATGRPSGPAAEFYRFAGSLGDPILNTINESRNNLYTLLRGGMSEIWMMDLPEEACYIPDAQRWASANIVHCGLTSQPIGNTLPSQTRKLSTPRTRKSAPTTPM